MRITLIFCIIFLAPLSTYISASFEFVIQGTNPPSLLRCGFWYPKTWKVVLPYEEEIKKDTPEEFKILHEFTTLHDIIFDNSNPEKSYILKSDYYTKQDIRNVYNIALTSKTPIDINNIIPNTSALIRTIHLADNLAASQRIKEKILESQHTEELIKNIYTHAQETNSVKDFIISSISQSDVLKQRFEPCFYRLLYTCPEWMETQKKLYKAPLLEPTEIQEILLPWQQSQAHTLYNEFFDKECSTMYDYYHAWYTKDTSKSDNERNRSAINFKKPVHSSRLHVPLLTYFMYCVHRFDDKRKMKNVMRDISYIRFKSVFTNTPSLHAIDTQSLEQHHNKTLPHEKTLYLEIPDLDTSSISSFQACRSNKLCFQLSSASNALRTALQTSSAFLQHGNSIYAIDPYWRVKIIAPWIVMAIGAYFCSKYALQPWYNSAVQCLENQKNEALNNYKTIIENLHISSTERALLDKIYTSHECKVGPIASSIIPTPASQHTYSSDQINKSFNDYLLIRNNSQKYNDTLGNIAMKSYAYIALYTVAKGLVIKIAYTIYKKCIPNTILFNPLKICMPIRWTLKLDCGPEIFLRWISKIDSVSPIFLDTPPIPTLCTISV